MNNALLAWFLARQRKRHRRSSRGAFPMTGEAFRRHFRMTKSAVRLLCSELAHLLEPRTAGGLSVEDQVLCTLRFFATGSFQSSVDSESTIDMSQSSVSRCIAKVARVIVVVGKERGWVAFPCTARERAAIKQGFLQQGRLGGVTGYFALAPRFAGSCHDAHVWRYASLRRRIVSGRIAVQDVEYLLGDSAYPLEPWLFTPAPGHPALHTPEGHYNAAHTSTRSAVERCIGVMKRRFRCLQRHRAFHYGPKKAATIVAACAALHNLCIDADVPHTGRVYPEGDDSDGDRPHASSSTGSRKSSTCKANCNTLHCS
ncbi:putative nuclease HARBI1 [Dermacentor albipictus]|uniref:putative nuclease HARBI1 n=1 Tax=Dermacentor albipictus TaxID=60249 RepID=UPI0031FE088F